MILHLGPPLPRFDAVEPSTSALILALDLNTYVGSNSQNDALKKTLAQGSFSVHCLILGVHEVTGSCETGYLLNRYFVAPTNTNCRIRTWH